MCGILAIARSIPAPEGRPALSDEALRRSMARLRWRGPDGEGVYQSPDGRVLLAHTRLAIQDLSEAGRQPMSTEDDSVVITFNGEIYNAPALRSELERAGAVFRSHADTEVLLHGYVQWGMDRLLGRVQGMFAFVILDQRERGRPVLHAAVDPAGMKPMVWRHSAGGADGEVLAIASDCDALLAACSELDGFSRRLDPTGLCHVLSVGYCPAPLTVWRGVNKLSPGQRFTWRPGQDAAPRVERYWEPPSELAPSKPDQQAQFEGLFRGVVDEHLLADVPVGLFLSAGLDSSAVALALAQGQRCDEVIAYTLSSRGIDPAFDEAPVAAAMCRAMMMRHRMLMVETVDVRALLAEAAAAFDEPQGFSALLTATGIARKASQSGLKVALAGDGGDEALAGYTWHSAAPHPLSLAEFKPASVGADGSINLADPACSSRDRTFAITQLAGLSYTHRYLARVFPGFHPIESRALLGALEPEYDAGVFADWLRPEDRPSLPHPRRAQRLDVLGFCAGSILPKVDRACMHSALELRAPFLDRRMLDWSLGRALESRAADSPNKQLLRSFLAPGVERGLVPPVLLNRPKQGFSLRVGAERPFESISAAVLPHSRLVRDGVLRKDYHAFLPVDAEARHVRLFTLTMLAEWYEHRAG